MRPSLFIIGAPKCGTTSLARYLAAHPAVCFSEPKEPKFFHTDFSDRHRYALTEAEYLRCFACDEAIHETAAEATVWYLYSREAVANILAFNPEARFIVMMRDPVELAHALHAQLYYGGDEDVADFERAWELQEPRRRGERLPPGCHDPKRLLYGDVARLGEQVERLLAQVERDRILFIRFERFVRDTRAAFDEVLTFAGLAPVPDITLVRHNENRALRAGPLTRFLFLGRRLKQAFGIQRSLGLWSALQPLIAERREREPLSPVFERELRRSFAQDIALLERLTGEDLTQWKP